MAAVTSASVLSTLLLLCISPVFVFVVQNITAREGENVSLPCSALQNSDIIVIEWSRRFQNFSHVVFLHRDGWFDPWNQHPSYKNRVELKDEQMKDGNMSLILKNVIISDTGTYDCLIQRGTDQIKTTETICTINLTVFQPGGDEDGNVGLKVGLSVVALLVGVVGVVMYRKRKGPKEETSYKAADDKDTDHQ
ncbi:myelin-oligodendrocyte glycoprotein-like [Channa argus]|uniref:myelin-oligodendrocyte glycoprotein-like n=1 Tax=Channa argus TaxID=215402 RepID=UPI0035223DE0